MHSRTWVTIVGFVMVASLTGFAGAQPLPDPVAYHSILGDDLTMNVWQGQYISILTPTTRTGLNNATMATIVGKLDLAYEYYKLATGKDPSPMPPNYYINNRDTIAMVDHTGGAGYSWIGATGIEIQTDYWNDLYNGVVNNNQYDQVTFYELGRNFWTMGSKLNGGASPNIGEYSFTTGFAVFMRFKSMEYAGVTGTPYGSWSFSQFEDNVKALVDTYTANTSLNFQNTLAVGQGVPGSQLGPTDLFASFLFRLGRDNGGDAFFMNFWKKVAERANATTDQGAIDNFFLASCYTTQKDLSNLFVNQWRWPISSAALYEATTIPVVGNAWTGATSNVWNNAGNWTGGVPANGDAITFPVGAANKTNSNNLLTRAGAVTFKEGGYTVSGNALQLDSGITTTGDNTWAINSTLTGPQSFTNFGGTLTVSGTVNTNGKMLTLNGNGDMNITGAISGSGGLVKDGTGVLTLGSNTFSGDVTINSGKVMMGSGTALGNTTGKTIMNGGSLENLKSTSEKFVIAGNALFHNYGGSPHLSGNIDINAGATLTFNTGGGNDTWVSGAITGAGNFTWIGGGGSEGWINTPSYIDGSAANTLSGTFTLEKGTLTLAKTIPNAAVGTGNLVIGGGSNRAQLRINSSEQIGDGTMMTFTGSDARFFPQGYNETLGALSVRGYGTIDFTGGNSTVRFADSSSVVWNKSLKLANYDSAADHLYIGSNSNGLTGVQLGRLQFVNPTGKAAGIYAGQMLPTGEVVPGAVWTQPATNPQFQMVPYPTTVVPGTGSMNLGSTSSIVINDAALRTAGGILSNEIYALTGKQLAVRRGTAAAGDIVLSLDNSLSGESYVYDVNSQAQVRGGNYQSVVQGTATLLQSLSKSGSTVTLPQAHIADQPTANTSYRAIQIDISRSYYSLDDLKQAVEMSRLYKIPYMQLHLTDDQAFTFATSVTGINGGNGTGTAGDSRTISVFSQDQLRDLVSFADQRGVTIVPEIEIPGHAGQMVSRRPDLFKTGWYHGSTANIANPDAITALKTMVGELAGIFASSPYIHLGGDEADMSELWYGKVNYVTGQGNGQPTVDPAIRAQWDAKMDALSAASGLPAGSIQNPEAVFRDYLNNMDDYVKSLGKKVIVWESFGMNETIVPLNKDITVMPFDLYYNPPATAIANGFDVINSSWSPLYVVGFKGDGTSSDPGLADTVANIYNWDKQQFGGFANPLGNASRQTLSDSMASSILGAQLNCWENKDTALINAARLRLAAMSERLWSAESDWTYDDFVARLTHTDSLLNSLLTTTGMAMPYFESIWSGAADGSWNSAGNWGTGGVPWDGDNITFSTGAGNKGNSNNVSGALLTQVGLVTFTEGGFNITGSPLKMNAGMKSTGDNTWAVATTLTLPQTFRSLSGTLSLPATIDTNGSGLGLSGQGNTNVSGVISGSGGLIKSGRGTATLTGANSYTGSTTVNGGTLVLDFATNTSVLQPTALVLGGGTLSIKGKNSGTTSETLGDASVTAGGSTVALDTNGGGSTTLTLGTITATTVGGSLAFTTTGTGTATIRTASNKNSTNIYGGRVTYNDDWATTSSGSGPYTISAYSGYTALPTGTTVSTTNYSVTGSVTRTNSGTVNTLKVAPTTASQVLNIGSTRTLTVSTGGLLFTGSQNYSITSGTLRGSSGGDLIVHQRSTGALTISSVIANNSSATGLTKAGSGLLVLGGTNTYTGQTYLNGGTVSISNNNNLGAVGTGAAINFNGGTLRSTAAVTLDNSGSNARNINLGGSGGTINLVGSAASLNISGVISGEGDLTWVGDSASPDTVSQITGATANTYTGSTFVTTGTLGLLKPAGMDAVCGDVVIGGGASRAVVKLLVSDQIGDSSVVTLKLTGDTTAGILRLNGFAETIGGLVSDAAGSGIVENGASGASTLTVATVPGTSYSYSGVFRNGASGAINLVKLGSGTQAITGQYAATGSIAVTAGELQMAKLMETAGQSVTVSAAANLLLDRVRGNDLVVNGTTTIRPSGLDANVSIFDATNTLTIGAAGKLDLKDNSMIVKGGNLATIQGQIKSAYANGTWSGYGITTSAGTAGGGLGVDTAGNLGLASFAGQTVASSDVLVMYTWLGDADFSGTVDFSDFLKLQAGYGKGAQTWANGDFNYDGSVDFSDFLLLQAAYGKPALSEVVNPVSIPEPATLSLLALGGLAMLRRRRAA